MMLMNKSQRFATFEYSKVKSPNAKEAKLSGDHDGDKPIDPGNIRKGTSVPKRENEYKAISEFIALSEITNEVDGRKYNGKVLWDIIVKNEITTTLEKRDEKEQADMMMKEALTEEERLCSTVTDEILGESSNRNNSENGMDISFDPDDMRRNGVESIKGEGADEDENGNDEMKVLETMMRKSLQ